MSILKLEVILTNGVRGEMLFEGGEDEAKELVDTTVTVTTESGEKIRGTVYELNLAA